VPNEYEFRCFFLGFWFFAQLHFAGDPLGDGKGGESILGGGFQEELHRSLSHVNPGTVTMANAGPNTN
jgi:cyclophilin family peptidyl-prolyl cis-trans isomerase